MNRQQPFPQVRLPSFSYSIAEVQQMPYNGASYYPSPAPIPVQQFLPPISQPLLQQPMPPAQRFPMSATLPTLPLDTFRLPPIQARNDRAYLSSESEDEERGRSRKKKKNIRRVVSAA